ncbi:hypothetical protein [Gracilimonas sp. BCB1]|uniref:hypothetical protein n=1 Tax=Gracilimonas sp. BCB1 TaxID=3152362 RepID=UPI0032DE0E16
MQKSTEKVLSRDLKLRNRKITHYFYISSVLYMSALVIMGFWPTYFSHVFNEFPVRHWSMHAHALIFIGWLLLLLVQISLVASNNVKLHRKLGVAGGLYGILMLVFGVSAAFMLPLERIESGAWTLDRGASFLIHPLGDLVIFVAFFIPALYYRRKSEIHKRLILIASLMLVFPGIARIGMGEFSTFFVWLFPLLAGASLDIMFRKRVHFLYLLGAAVLVLSVVGRYYISGSALWLETGRYLLSIF